MTSFKKISQSATFRILFSGDIIPRCVPFRYRIYLLVSKLRHSLVKRLTGQRARMPEKSSLPFLTDVRFGSVLNPLINKSFMSRETDLSLHETCLYVRALEDLKTRFESKGLRTTSAGGSFKLKDYRPEKERNKLWENAWVLTQVRPKSTDVILDLGGASTLFSCYLASLGCQMHVLDYDMGHHGLIYNGRYVAGAMNWKNLKLYNRDLARPLPFADNTFDKVTCICVMEHLPREVRRRTMKEIARVLKRGGMAALTIDFDLGRNDKGCDQGLRFGDKERLEKDILVSKNLKIFGNDVLKDDCPPEFFLGSLFLVKH